MTYVPLYEVFFDLPHPDASPQCEQAKLVGPHPSIEETGSRVTTELYAAENVARIIRYAFPDYDEKQRSSSKSKKDKNALNRHDVYLQSFTSHHHTFSLRLQCGIRIHGHVRRYLPPHHSAGSRGDVGRRGARAMVIITRAPGAERFFASVLKTIEALSIEQAAVPSLVTTQMPQQSFLFALHEQHEALFHDKDSLNSTGLTLQISGLEFGKIGETALGDYQDKITLSQDFVRFVIPPSLCPRDEVTELAVEDIDSPMVPLLRCVSASHYMRLLSALLCERRVIMISSNLTKLSTCVRGAAAMLAQGLMAWQHVYIPILPPHLLKYLGTPAPYLIGLLEAYARNLEVIPGMGEVVCVNLDNNTIWTYHIPDPATSIPDLLKHTTSKKIKENTSHDSMAAIDSLAWDLKAVIKTDQRTWAREVDGSTSTSPTEPPSLKPSGKIERNTSIFKLFGRKSASSFSEQQQQPDGSFSVSFRKEHPESPPELIEKEELEIGTEDIMSTLYSCRDNELGEEAIRVALVTFFLYLYGDMGMYLTELPDGRISLDRKKFLLIKKMQGDKESTPIFILLANLTKSSMFQQFVKARINELESEETKPNDSIDLPLFSRCERYLVFNQSETTKPNFALIVKKFAESSIQRDMVQLSEDIQMRALTLLARSQAFDTNAVNELLALCEESRDVVTVLPYLLGIIQRRFQKLGRDQWRKLLISLRMLRSLLLFGPITAIPEAVDLVDLLRCLMVFSPGRSSECIKDVRELGACVFDLIMDRSRLFTQRRACAARKKQANISDQVRWEDYLMRRLPLSVGFNHMHFLLHPAIDVEPMSSSYSYCEKSLEQTDASETQSASNNKTNQNETIGEDTSNEIHDMLNSFNSTIEAPEDVAAEARQHTVSAYPDMDEDNISSCSGSQSILSSLESLEDDISSDLDSFDEYDENTISIPGAVEGNESSLSRHMQLLKSYEVGDRSVQNRDTFSKTRQGAQVPILQ